jgi:hypothetical protein
VSSPITKQVKSQLRESSKKVVEDTGRHLADIPKEAGRHIVGIDGPVQQSGIDDHSEFSEQELSLEELEKRQDKLDTARIKQLEAEITALSKKRKSENEKRLKTTTQELKSERKTDYRSKNTNKVSPFENKLKSRMGSRELGRGLKG